MHRRHVTDWMICCHLLFFGMSYCHASMAPLWATLFDIAAEVLENSNDPGKPLFSGCVQNSMAFYNARNTK